MVTFQVSDMTCGHCASAIFRAVASVDKDARVDIRIQQKLVRIDSSAAAAELAEAIRDAGYTPQEVRQEPAQPTVQRASAGCGCGCGCGPGKAAENESSRGLLASGSCCAS
ncbi:heavy-metal-associated domain-containing protein [Ramlibacter terrae]|uniref:Heavy-metal-associated domain-containing protein n=1 Tax=Ramlibacter terrae TaxID=2732511 RepID=A0ABX6P646_9BURK|nr:heavy-metal-associated domain-containing protein [Ramlibacter terrae]